MVGKFNCPPCSECGSKRVWGHWVLNGEVGVGLQYWVSHCEFCGTNKMELKYRE